MDCFGSKKRGNYYNNNNTKCEKDLRGLAEKVKLLQEEIRAIMNEREKESRGYERDMMVFAFQEAEWKQEKKKSKDEMKRMKKNLDEKDEKIKEMEDGILMVNNGEKENKSWLFSASGKSSSTTNGNSNTSTVTAASSFLMEHIKEERVWRDEAVDKWKKLYLAIKTELDDLIQRTHREGLYWRAEEEDTIEELKIEMKAKDETIEELKSRLALLEYEEYKRAREIDILRQSLKIMSSKKSPNYAPSAKTKLTLAKQIRKA